MKRDVTILAIERVKSEPRSDGSQVLAFFDADIPNIRMIGCVLIRLPGGGVRFYPPEARSRKYDRAPIVFTNSDLHHQMLSAAIRAWRGLDDADVAA